MTLGAVTALSPTRARDAAAELHAQVRLGHDPAGAKIDARAQVAETFGALVRVYLAEHKKPQLRRRSYIEVERHLLKNCKPLHGLQLARIDRRAVAALMSTLAARCGNVATNRTRSSLHAFFAWTIREGLADTNPVAGTNVRPEQSRAHTLDDAELRAIWAATAGPGDYNAAVRLLLLTGCRLSEIAGLRWTEAYDGAIHLPPERTKNKQPHNVPLSGPAQRILDARPRHPGKDFVFGRYDGRPMSGASQLKVELDGRIRSAGVKMSAWCHHDLRRTCATRMGGLGVLPHVIEAVLNHASGSKRGVAGIYNRSPYEPEKAAALTLWANRLLEIIEGTSRKVVPLRA